MYGVSNTKQGAHRERLHGRKSRSGWALSAGPETTSSALILAIYQAGTAGQCKPNIFVASIDPSYEVVGRGFLISTSIVIQDENGIGIEGASAQIKTIFPSGSVLDFPVTTDATGEASISFGTEDSGLYKFKVRRVTHPTRECDPSLNIEITDTLLIP